MFLAHSIIVWIVIFHSAAVLLSNITKTKTEINLEVFLSLKRSVALLKIMLIVKNRGKWMHLLDDRESSHKISQSSYSLAEKITFLHSVSIRQTDRSTDISNYMYLFLMICTYINISETRIENISWYTLFDCLLAAFKSML